MIKKIRIWLTIYLMEYNLKNSIKDEDKQEHIIIKKAYKNMIDHYKKTIMFLKSELGK